MTSGGQLVKQVVLIFIAFFTVPAFTENVHGVVGGSALLNCPCEDRNPSNFLSWQLGDTDRVLHCETGSNITEVGERYADRVKLTEGCSLFISNLSVEDEGTYKCSFFHPHFYYTTIVLNVSASYNVCMDQIPEVSRGGRSMFQCKASGGYPKGKIQWYLKDKLLHNISKMDYSEKDPATGLFDLSSNLTIVLNDSADSQLKCVVETQGMPLQTSSSCGSKPSNFETMTQETAVAVSISVILCVIAVLLGVLALVMFMRRRKRGKYHPEEGTKKVPY